MRARPCAALAIGMFALPAYAGSAGPARVEVVAELGNLGSAPSASAVSGAAPLQLAPNTFIPIMSLAVSAIEPAAPAATLALAPLTPAALVPVKPAVRPSLIKTLAVPALDVSKLDMNDSAGTAESDFNARAQLDAPAAPLAGAVSAPSASAEARAWKVRDRGAALDAYEDGSLGVRSPALNAALDEAGQKAMREVLAKAKFKTSFLYGGFFGTYIYDSPDLPGVILKVYKRPLDLFGLGSSASRGYALAKAKLGGLFAETSIVMDAEIEIDGKPRRYGRVLVQELIETKDVKNWGRRANETHEAMRRRGVQDTDLGPRRGVYAPHLVRNLGETRDGSLVHFDADRFKTVKGATESGRRVPDPEPLRGAARAAQERLLSALWADTP